MKSLSLGLAVLLILSGGLWSQGIAPELYDFDVHPDGLTLDQCAYAGWAQSGDHIWQSDSGGTPSSNTGPTAGNPGSYMYCETSGAAVGWTFVSELPLTDVTGIAGAAINYDYHMFDLSGLDMGTLTVEEHDGSGWVSIASHSGDMGTAWLSNSVAVAPIGGQVRIRFHYTGATSFQGDIAMDNIWIGDPAGPPPASAPAAGAPPPPVCAVGVALNQLETFDASSSLPLGWTPSACVNAFSVDANGTPSSGTGPSDDITGGGNYLFLEASPGPAGSQFGLEIPCTNITPFTNPTLHFHYHMLGSNMGTLEVQENQGGAWVTIWSETGNKGDVWIEAQTPILTGPIAQVRFLGIRGPGFAGDMAFDHCQIQEQIREWEINSPECDLNLDGIVNAYIEGPIQALGCVGVAHTLNVGSTLVGNGWDIAIGSVPTLPASAVGLLTAGGQAINMDVSDLSLTSLFGFLYTNAFPGSGPIPLSSSTPSLLSAQMILIDGAHADGFQLSAANEFTAAGFTPLAAPEAGPAGDDSFSTHSIGCFEYYGVAYSELHVSSNGRITFGQGSSNFGPSTNPLVHLTEPPALGFWTDMDPSVGGTISVSSPTPTTVRVDFAGVPYFGEPLTANTYYMELDASGVVVIGGLGTIGNNPAAAAGNGDMIWLGVSNGNVGATDAGFSLFGVGGPNVPANGTDAIYNYGPSDALTPVFTYFGAANQLTFAPDATVVPNFNWTGL